MHDFFAVIPARAGSKGIPGKNKMEILSEFRKRILNSVDEEFNEAIIQVGKIANLRLNEINIK